MKEARLEWRKYKYFPYEREFAALEAAKIFQAPVRAAMGGLNVPADVFTADRAKRLTYFARAVAADGDIIIPQQVHLEASAFSSERDKQSTRYSAHGLHEYKGKFNPQIVRAIGNILGLRSNAVVLDPFCGSGTTLLECAHAGWTAIGVDRNPLAVRIANAKIRALHRAEGRFLDRLAASVSTSLRAPAEALSNNDDVATNTIESVLGRDWHRELPCNQYLRAWFPAPVLAQIVAIRRTLKGCVPLEDDRQIFEVVLSDHLRGASLQDPADLRIRRRKNPQPNYPLIDWYKESLCEKLERVQRARRAIGQIQGTQVAVLGDARRTDLKSLQTVSRSGYDAVITSPPYETALPYIDTQRLSLVLLGDVDASAVLATEQTLIGAREISTAERRELEAEIVGGTDELPLSVVTLCRQLLRESRRDGNGFRRVNRPALTFRYFRFMSAALRNIRTAVRPRAKVALVVGVNRTRLGGKDYEIDTPMLLAHVAKRVGYDLEDMRRMDTYARYDLHSKNSIRGECLLVLSAPGE